jgi:imidazolonepropionase-like amidohydrolase
MRPQRDSTIVIENGRIRDIDPSFLIQAPGGTAMIDLTGKFIVPGIINAHGHVGPNRDPQPRQYALYGVTTTTSMSFNDDDIA